MEFTYQEKQQLIALRRVTSPTGDQMDLIFKLYKKYINPAISHYVTGCSCHNDIATIYWDLLDWFSNNENNFANE